MKTIIALISFCFLLPLAYVHAGKVKTIDGKQMPKDSVAEFYLTEQIGKRFADSILFVYAVKIDTVTVSEMLHGVKDDYSIAENPNTSRSNWDFDKCDYEFSEAYQLRKVQLAPGKHTLTLRCLARFTTKKEDDIFFTTPFLLGMEVTAKHIYNLKIRFARPLWHIAVEDKTTKTTVATATTSVISK
jgi:hypothetical protein